MYFSTSLILAVAVPAVLTTTVSRRWLGLTILAWLTSPLLVYCSLVAQDVVAHLPATDSLGNAFYGLMLVSSIAALPWLTSCLIGVGLGLVLRRALRGTHDTMHAPNQPRSSEASPLSTCDSASEPRNLSHLQASNMASNAARPPPHTRWREAHIGFEGDGLHIRGLSVWHCEWRSARAEPLCLPDPTQPRQSQLYELYEIGDLHRSNRFAASELSEGVWSFYVPAERPFEPHGASTDGSSYAHCSEDPPHGRDDDAPSWALLIGTANEHVLIDCTFWTSSRITKAPDGNLFLLLQHDYFDSLFRIEPIEGLFADHGESGVREPLSYLAHTVEQARQRRRQHDGTAAYRRISPDGTIRVDLATMEWSSSHWVASPRVTEIASGRVLLDLWGTDWDATIWFPGNQRLRLDLRRYLHPGNLMVELDLARATYQVLTSTSLPGTPMEVPIAEIASGLEAASRHSFDVAASAGDANGPRGKVNAPRA